MRDFLDGFGTELIKLAADPRLNQLAPPKPAGNVPAPYQTPRTGVAGTPAPAPNNQGGSSSASLRAMAPQAMQSPTGAGKVDTYRPLQAFQQKAPPPPMPQPAQATPGGAARSATAQSGRWAYESGGNFLARRAGETLQNVMSPVTKNFGVAAKPTGVGPSPTERAKQQQQAAQTARFSPGAIGNHMTRFM